MRQTAGRRRRTSAERAGTPIIPRRPVACPRNASWRSSTAGAGGRASSAAHLGLVEVAHAVSGERLGLPVPVGGEVPGEAGDADVCTGDGVDVARPEVRPGDGGGRGPSAGRRVAGAALGVEAQRRSQCSWLPCIQTRGRGRSRRREGSSSWPVSRPALPAVRSPTCSRALARGSRAATAKRGSRSPWASPTPSRRTLLVPEPCDPARPCSAPEKQRTLRNLAASQGHPCVRAPRRMAVGALARDRSLRPARASPTRDCRPRGGPAGRLPAPGPPRTQIAQLFPRARDPLPRAAPGGGARLPPVRSTLGGRGAGVKGSRAPRRRIRRRRGLGQPPRAPGRARRPGRRRGRPAASRCGRPARRPARR